MDVLGGLFYFAVILALYFCPAIVAGLRGVIKTNGIVLVNVFLGWTIIGWVAALVWAVQAQTRSEVKRCPACASTCDARAKICHACRAEFSAKPDYRSTGVTL